MILHYMPNLKGDWTLISGRVYCQPNVSIIRSGAGNLATDKRAEVTCKKCLAKLAGPKPAASKPAARPVRVHIALTDRRNGDSCIQVFRGQDDLLFEILPTAAADKRLAALVDEYPGAKVERY